MRDLSWLRFLPSDAINEFVDDLAKAVTAEEDLDPVFASWKATAEVYADPELHERLTTPSDGDYGPVPIPGLE